MVCAVLAGCVQKSSSWNTGGRPSLGSAEDREGAAAAAAAVAAALSAAEMAEKKDKREKTKQRKLQQKLRGDF